MHDSIDILKTGLLSSTSSLSLVSHLEISVFDLFKSFENSLELFPFLSAITGVIAAVSSKTVFLKSSTASLLVVIFMPSLAGVEQDAGNPLTPSICTRHVLHAPIGFMSGSLHNCDIGVPDIFIASRTELPSSRVILLPFTVTSINLILPGFPAIKYFFWEMM